MTRRRVALVVLTLLVLAGIVLAYQAVVAGLALRGAQDTAQRLQARIGAGDVAGAQRERRTLAEQTGRAAGHTDGPLWAVAEHLPWLGEDATAVRRSALALDAVSSRALPVLLRAAEDVRSGRLGLHHGRMQLAALGRYAAPLRRAEQALAAPAAGLAQVHAAGLVGPLAGRVRSLQERVAATESGLRAGATAARVLPGALGAGGPRRYLLLTQTNAEIRASGGMPGSWAVLDAAHGRLRLGRQGSGSDLYFPGHPAVRPSAAERELFGSFLGDDLRGTAYTPDFPSEARMAAGLLRRRTGQQVDGVLAVDPIALSLVMRGTGPIDVGGGLHLGADNVAQVLLSDVYRSVRDPHRQDAVFAGAARAVFGALTSGTGDKVAALSGLAQATDQGRVRMWSRPGPLARAVAGTRLAGAVEGDTGHTPQLGVYLNDSTASKMQYYLRFGTRVRAQRCLSDGTREITVRTRLRSVTPPGIAHFPVYVTGGGAFARPGTMQMQLYYYAPYAGAVTSLRVGGKEATVSGVTVKGRPVAALPVRLPPGGTLDVQATVRTGRGQGGPLQIASTPGMRQVPDPVSVPSSCAG